MRTYEVSFICDGRKVLGDSCKCLCMVAGATTKNKADERLPAGWMAVLLSGRNHPVSGRHELCPECAGVWREQARRRANQGLTPEAVMEFRHRCARFDWAYAWTDDHSVYLEKDREFQDLWDLANTHPVLREIFDQENTTTKRKAVVA